MRSALTVAVGTNGTAPARGKRPAPAKGKRPGPAARAQAKAAQRAVRWSHWYTGTAIVLSSGLNGFAAVQASGASGAAGMVTAAGIGAVVPVLVWMLSTVTAWTYRAGWKRLALVSGAVAACVLALSVVHVATALAALTGTPLYLAGLMAVGIDCGLLSSEATAILVSSVD
jgi:hypothetical protein